MALSRSSERQKISDRAKSDNEKSEVTDRLRVYNRRPVEHFRRVWNTQRNNCDPKLPRMVDTGKLD